MVLPTRISTFFYQPGPRCDDEGDQNFILPLSFDRVYNGHITTSAFPLFKMPIELFTDVMRCLSRSDLQALALVDRDCYRLASLILFKKVHIKLVPRSPLSQLPQKSDIETRHLDTSFSNDLPSKFLDCVREIVIHGDGGCLELGGGSELGNKDGYNGDMLFLASGNIMAFDRIFSSSLANLQVLHWHGPSLGASDIMRCIHHPPLKHVYFRGMIIDHQGLESRTPEGGLTSISNVETLSLDIWASPTFFDARSIPFFQRLLRSVQSSLRSFTWKGRLSHNIDDKTILRANDFDALCFPNLRSVTLAEIAPSDATHIYQTFLDNHHPTQIRCLSMETGTPSSRIFFNARGYISSLKHLSLFNNHEGISTYPYEALDFLENNSQLETLHLGIATPQTTIDESLMPLLQQNFTMLTSLRVTFDEGGWDGPTSRLESSLRAISSLTALRRLWLAAGGIRGFRNWSWNICHRDVVEFLTPLVNLELLAFSHDAYTVPNLHPLAPRNHFSADYYMNRAIPADVLHEIARYLTPVEYSIHLGREGCNLDFEVALSEQRRVRDLAWERWHLECMLKVVNGCYAQSLGALKWCFVGQLGFSNDQGPVTQARSSGPHFTVEREGRDPCLAILRRKMAIEI